MVGADKIREGQSIRTGGLVDKGYFRTDNSKPKVMVMKDHEEYERKGIGPLTSKWLHTTFKVEVWSDFATQVKSIAKQISDLVQASEIPPIGPQYSIVEMVVESVEPYDYLPEFKAYMVLLTIKVTSEEVFA